MNLRYIKNILPGASMLLALGLGSCTGDLDVTPIDPGTVMTPSEPSLYTKCYSNMALEGNYGANGDCDIDGIDGGTSNFVRQMWNANELTTDEAICAWGDEGIPAFNYNQYDSSHPMLKGLYYRCYTGIAFCNHYMEVCPPESGDATRFAEVRFLRALYFYYLMDMFGNVPFTMAVTNVNPEQATRAQMFEFIESELKACLPDMQTPVARTSSSDGYGRADQDAANLLLARLYLNAEVYTGTARWNDAKTYAEKVINGPHALWTTDMNGWSAYQMLFMGDNGETGASVEAILPLMLDGVTTTSWGSTLFLMASCWKDDMNTGDNYGTNQFWAGNRARKAFIDKFFPFGDAPNADVADMQIAANDDRALFFGIKRELAVTKPTEFTSGFSVAKFRNTYASGGAPHNSQFVDTDYFLMRSAEAYLIAAEADAHLNGGTTTACAKYINALRSRAHNGVQLNSYSLDDILDERARELYHEGFRRTDLIRYGYYNSNTYLWEWKGGAEGGVSFSATRNIFAIPQDDINTNPNLTQNPGY